METGINIQGGDVDREAVGEVAKAIDQIFGSAAKNNMDQDTVRAALTALGNLGTVHSTSISGSHFEG